MTTETEARSVSKRAVCILLECCLVSQNDSVEGKLSWLLTQRSSFVAMSTDEIALFLFNQLSSVHLSVQNHLFIPKLAILTLTVKKQLALKM